ncbi:DUF4349 domain-containing protein [Streptomyces sp. NPDC008313]|uniref:DUF4349 domain-containing protein n=1 Tax=Streptomyces sp. NPDC008313 TaxID=3364826 RepID=UPI0036E4EBD7
MSTLSTMGTQHTRRRRRGHARAGRPARPVQVLAAALLAATLGLAGCGAAGGDSASDKRDTSAARRDAAGAAGSAADNGKSSEGGASAESPVPAASHIVRTASLTVRVKDVPKALAEARTTAETAGGFVGNETTTRDGKGRERTRVVLRVPTDAYDDVLGGLQGTGEVLEQRAKATDVTDQVVDVDSRVRSQRASVARIRELMDRATKLSDVVTLEGELSSRQADLEALLARQAALKDRTGLATITLSLSETAVKKADTDDGPGFVDALAGGWDAFVTMLRWIALVLGAMLPFAALAALLALLWVRLVRPRLPRRPAPGPVTAPVPAPAAPGRSGTLPVAPPVRREDGAREEDGRKESGLGD